MKVLVVGSGGREHSIIWKLNQSPKVNKIYAAPGNAGIAEIAECVPISVEDIEKLADFAENNKIDLTVVGPEVPLVLGITDLFNNRGLKVFGPSKKAAQLEGSKAFSKEFMQKYNIPTARFGIYTNVEESKTALNEYTYPVVIKASGLAAGKGVIIALTKEEAEKTIEDMILNNKFGDSGKEIVIEEFLEGKEISCLCFVDGKSIIPMESAMDYKRAYDNDMGLNTGGMGTISPNPIFTPEIAKEVEETVLKRTLHAIQSEEMDFKGIVFIGLMLTKNGVKVLEYNVRFGDPETQSVLPRLESDLFDVMMDTVNGELGKTEMVWSNKYSICVVGAAGGYPDSYEKGKVISGLNSLDEGVRVFHAGTKLENGNVVSNGGRVLGVNVLADTPSELLEKVYKNIEKISFEGMFYRKDIGKIFLEK